MNLTYGVRSENVTFSAISATRFAMRAAIISNGDASPAEAFGGAGFVLAVALEDIALLGPLVLEDREVVGLLGGFGEVSLALLFGFLIVDAILVIPFSRIKDLSFVRAWEKGEDLCCSVIQYKPL